jgi:DNA processing protein
MALSDDSIAIIMLCSHLGLPPKPEPAPLTLRSWNPIAKKLSAAELRPNDLLGKTSAEIESILGISDKEANRISKLLSRGGSIAIELEKLSSLGIWVCTRADDHYPGKYKERLKEAAPPVIFGAGNEDLPGDPGIAVVGSRNVDQAGQEFAEFIGNACSFHGMVVYSGGARGVDILSMKAAIDGRGYSVGVLAHSLVKVIREPENRQAISSGYLTLITSYSPYAGFSVGAAMGRNKLIYTLADYGLVIASDLGKGGTWTGANEVLKNGWVPLFAVSGPGVPEGNKELITKGAKPMPAPFPVDVKEFKNWLAEHSSRPDPTPRQLDLL